MQHIAERFAAIVGLSPDEEETDALIADYLEAWSLGVTLAEEALDCVRRLAADYRVAVVSNTHAPELVPGLMRRLGLDVLIPDVFTSVEIGWRKPHPSIYQHVVATDRVDAGDAVFVGDNPIADVAGPRAFGMTAFHITREPLALFPDAVTLGELPALIRQLPERASNSQ